MENLEIKNLYSGCYRNKRVIVTGNTGFKGAWLSIWLLEMGAEVYGISNGIPTQPSLFELTGLENKIKYHTADIRNKEEINILFSEIKPDFVFHLAAQSIVLRSYADPVETFNTNIMGTVHILEALRNLTNNCTAILITSDKCYDNVEWLWGYRETDLLGGKDPYSASKGAAEFMIRSYYNSYFAKNNTNIRMASLRAGNVIGGGDWAESRIVPDCMRSWIRDEAVEIRNPYATRPWQHVLEPLSGYLLVGQSLMESADVNGESFNIGPSTEQNKTVLQLLSDLASYWGNKSDQLYTVVPNMAAHEAGLLKLNCDKALHMLEWKPVLNFKETARLTSLWYRSLADQKNNLLEFTISQINEYIQIAKSKNLIWCRN